MSSPGFVEIRTLQRFKVCEPKREPVQLGDFKRGHALKYNRWARVRAGLPFDAGAIAIGANDLPAGKQISDVGQISRAANQVFTGDWQ